MLIKKIWYLRDQQIVATTNQLNHQAADQVVLTVQKDHLLHPVEDHLQVHLTDQKKEIQKVLVKKDQARRNHSLLLQVAASRMPEKVVVNIKAVLLVAKRKLLYHAANHIRADQLKVKIAQKELLAVIQPLEGRHAANHIQAG